MITAVFDCMVFFQAAVNESGPAFGCFSLVVDGKVELFVSPAILAEVREVLSRPKLRAKFPHLIPDRVDLFLQKVGQLANMIPDVARLYSLPRDPDDEPYLNLALSCKVGYLVTWDNDLLDLTKEKEFAQQFPALNLVNPVDFLRVIRGPA